MVIGALPAVGLAGIFVFYNIVIGWILKYLSMSLTGKLGKIDKNTYFDQFAGTSASIPWDLLSILLTVLIISFGVTKGIERISKIIMPALFVIFLLLAVRSLTLPGAMGGVRFLLQPDWKQLGKVNTWVMALGQAFFTVSINGCGMVAYGSYLKKEYNIPKLSLTTAVLDTMAALLASFVIMPAVFAFHVDVNAGPPLLFMTMPAIFDKMPGGNIIAPIFFISLLFAAISSSINMLEGVTEAVISNTSVTRRKAAVMIGVILGAASIPLNLSMHAFDNFTNFITILVSPLMVILVLIVFFYLYDKKKTVQEINQGGTIKFGEKYVLFVKYVFLAVTVLVVILGAVYGGIG